MKKWLGLLLLLFVATAAFADPVPVSVQFLDNSGTPLGFPDGAFGPYNAYVTDPIGTSIQPVICFSLLNPPENFTGLKYSINTVDGQWGLSTFDYNVLGFLADELFGAVQGTDDARNLQRAIWKYAGFVPANWFTDNFDAATQAAINSLIDTAVAGVNAGYVTGNYFLIPEEGSDAQPLIERAPEPTSMLLLGSGILSIAGAVRRKMAK